VTIGLYHTLLGFADKKTQGVAVSVGRVVGAFFNLLAIGVIGLLIGIAFGLLSALLTKTTKHVRGTCAAQLTFSIPRARCMPSLASLWLKNHLLKLAPVTACHVIYCSVRAPVDPWHRLPLLHVRRVIPLLWHY